MNSSHPSPLPTHLRLHQLAGLQTGPRLLVSAAVHGNEVCGVSAIQRVLEAFDSGSLTLLRGTLTLLPIANPLAHRLGRREGERNLNRNMRPPVVPQDFEDRLNTQLCPLLAAHDVLLDLHSFQSQGQPFLMLGPRDNDGELEPFEHATQEAALAACLGPARIVEGWLSTYALGLQRRAARGSDGSRAQTLVQDPHYGVGTTEYMRSRGGYGLTLECGQHDDASAPDVAYLAILRTLVQLRMLAADAVEPHRPTQPPELLQLYDVIDREHADDQFERAWASFDAVVQGQTIGTRHDGTPVLASSDGRVVFPNSRAQVGQEWFYLARASDRVCS
jgi:succinylglutamate desuccinylase